MARAALCRQREGKTRQRAVNRAYKELPWRLRGCFRACGSTFYWSLRALPEISPVLQCPPTGHGVLEMPHRRDSALAKLRTCSQITASIAQILLHHLMLTRNITRTCIS